MKRILIILGGFALMVITISYISKQDDPWKVPKKYQILQNPVIADDASISSGRELYTTYCRSCHGKDGKGSGQRAYKLDTSPTDFTLDSFQKQTDGALLYKIYSGHRDMPGFKKRIPGNEDAIEGTFGKTRMPGDLVNYVRTFAKK